MPENQNDSPVQAGGYDSLEWQPEGDAGQAEPQADGTGKGQAQTNGEDVAGGDATDGGSTADGDLQNLRQRLKETQTEFHRKSEENAELKGVVEKLTGILEAVQSGGKNQQQTQQQAGVSDADLTAYAERVAKEKGVGPAIRDVAQFVASQMVEPVYQRLQQFETRMTTPDYNKLEGRVNKYLQEVQSGKLNADQMLVRLAKAEDALENAKTNPGTRQPDNPARGAGIGNKSASQPAAGGQPSVDLAKLQNMGSAEDIAKVMLRQNPPKGLRDVLYRNHPNLRPKG